MIGTAIGTGIGILFAPDKGRETRKKIVGQSGDLTDGIKNKVGEFLDSIKQEMDAMNKKAEDIKG